MMRLSNNQRTKQIIKLVANWLFLAFGVFAIHEIGHIIAQLIFGVPIVISFGPRWVSTNDSQLLQYTNSFGAIAVILSGPLAPITMFPYVRKLANDTKIRYSRQTFYTLFTLMAIGAAIHDICLIVRLVAF